MLPPYMLAISEPSQDTSPSDKYSQPTTHILQCTTFEFQRPYILDNSLSKEIRATRGNKNFRRALQSISHLSIGERSEPSEERRIENFLLLRMLVCCTYVHSCQGKVAVVIL